MDADWKSLIRHPLSAEYKDIAGADWYGFTLTMKRVGFLPERPIILHESKVLDGWQRFRACVELNIEPVFATLADGLDPREYVEVVNDTRRHESAEERQARRERTAEARKEGKSLRTIAKEQGVSTTTVVKDLKESQVYTGVTPEPESGKVTGSDGRQQAATKPKILCRHCEHRLNIGRPLLQDCPDCAELRKVLKPKREPKEKEPEAEEPRKDDSGAIVPIRLLPVFQEVAVFAEAERALTACAKVFKRLEAGPAKDAKPVDPKAAFTRYFPTFKSAREKVQNMRPSLVCSDCLGDGCTRCRNLGWLTREMAGS